MENATSGKMSVLEAGGDLGGSHSGVGDESGTATSAKREHSEADEPAARRRISPRVNSADGSGCKSGDIVGRWVEGRMAAEALKNGMYSGSG